MVPSEFERLVRTLSGEELRSLVADIWTARGWETTVSGGVVVTSDPKRGETRTIAVVGEDKRCTDILASEARTVDVLVTPNERDHVRDVAERHDIRYVGPEDLYGMLLYAIDRDIGESLFRRYFDRPVDPRDPGRESDDTVDEPRTDSDDGVSTVRDRAMRNDRADRVVVPDDGSAARELRNPEGNGDRESSVDASDLGPVNSDAGPEVSVIRGIPPSGEKVAFVLVAIVALSLAVWTVFGGMPGSTGAEGPPEQPLVTPPPGLDTDGITNVTVLARTHEAKISGRAYRLRFRHEGSRGRLVTGSRWVDGEGVVRVDGTGDYWFELNGTLPPKTVGGQTRRVDFVEYGDESNCYRRPAPSSTGWTPDPVDCHQNLANGTVDRFAGTIAAYVLRFLDTTRTSVERIQVDAGYRYRVVATGTPNRIDRDVEDYHATAIVTRTGVVRRLQVRYTYRSRDGPETVRFEYSYGAIGEVAVSSPDWIGTEATDRSTTTDEEERPSVFGPLVVVLRKRDT